MKKRTLMILSAIVVAVGNANGVAGDGCCSYVEYVEPVYRTKDGTELPLLSYPEAMEELALANKAHLELKLARTQLKDLQAERDELRTVLKNSQEEAEWQRNLAKEALRRATEQREKAESQAKTVMALRAELEETVKGLKDAKATCETQAQQLAAAQEAKEKANCENACVKAKLAKLQNEKCKLLEQQLKASRELRELKRNCETQARQLVAAQQANKRLNCANACAKAKLAELKDEHSEVLEQQAKMLEELQGMKTTCETQAQQLAAAQEANKKANCENVSLKGRLSKLQDEHTKLLEQQAKTLEGLQKLERTCIVQAQQLVASGEATETAKCENASLKAKLAKLQDDHTKLQEQQAKTRAERQDLRAACEARTQELAAAREAIEKAKCENAGMKARVGKLLSENRNLKTACVTQAQQLGAAQEAAKKANRESAGAKADLSKAQDENAALRTRLVTAENATDVTQEALVQLLAQLTSITQKDAEK